MIIGNVLYIIWDREYAVIVLGRLLISLAHGMVFIVVLRQAGENASRNMRGLIVSLINCMTFAGFFIALHVTATVFVADNNNVTPERIIGSIAAAVIFGSIICTFTVNIETVPHLLTKNQRIIAMENMKRLRDVAFETPQMTSEMNEMEAMVARDQQDNSNVFVHGNAKPLMLLILTRLMASLTNNFVLNSMMVESCELVLSNFEYASLMIIAPRMATSIVQIFYADYVGRKIQLIVSGGLAGLILTGLGIVVNVATVTVITNYYIPCVFFMHFQLVCGLGIQQMADVYLAESFPNSKIWSLPFVMTIEHAFQVFMIGMAFTTITRGGFYALVYASGGLLIVFGLVLVFTLPETKGTTLKEARDLLRNEKFFHLM